MLKGLYLDVNLIIHFVVFIRIILELYFVEEIVLNEKCNYIVSYIY